LISGLLCEEAAQGSNLSAQFGRLFAYSCAGGQLFLVGRILLLQLEVHLGKLPLRSLKHGTLLIHLGKLSLCSLKQRILGRPGRSFVSSFVVGFGRPVGRQLVV